MLLHILSSIAEYLVSFTGKMVVYTVQTMQFDHCRSHGTTQRI